MHGEWLDDHRRRRNGFTVGFIIIFQMLQWKSFRLATIRMGSFGLGQFMTLQLSSPQFQQFVLDGWVGSVIMTETLSTSGQTAIFHMLL